MIMFWHLLSTGDWRAKCHKCTGCPRSVQTSGWTRKGFSMRKRTVTGRDQLWWVWGQKLKENIFFEILLGRSEICSEHVDLLQSRGLQWWKTHGKTSGSTRWTRLWKPSTERGRILDEHHEWRPPLSINAKFWRLLDHDIEIPCVVQWGMLWYSALTGSNNDLLNDGVFSRDTTKWYGHRNISQLSLLEKAHAQGLPWYTARQDGGGGPKGKWMVGTCEEDLIYCLRMKTTDKALNLRFFLKHSLQQKPARPIEVKQCNGRKIGTNSDKKEMRWRYVTKSFHEAGLQIRNQESLMTKECQGKPERILLMITRKDKRKKEKNLKTASTPGFGVAMTPKLPNNRKSLVEEELRQCFGRYQATWRCVERKTEVVTEKAWQFSQSSNKKSQRLDADFVKPF